MQTGYITATLQKMHRDGCFHVYDKTLIICNEFKKVAQSGWGSSGGSSGSYFMLLALYLFLVDLCLILQLEF